METKMHLTDLHNERKTWLTSLAFCKDEIESMTNRLGEIASANNKLEVTAQVEHFQNQFILQREVIDVMRHNIQESENDMAKQIEANPVATDHKTAPDHTIRREQMVTFENLFAELKAEFNTFAAKTL